MSQLPPTPGYAWAAPGGSEFAPPQKTSGMAIASLVCGIISLFTCCTILPSILGTTFGAVALGAIRRGEVGGRSLAISGLVLSVVGLIMGVTVWVLVAKSPPGGVIAGAEVSESDRAKLESLGVVEPNEGIELLYCTGMMSYDEGGVVLTGDRLIFWYGPDSTEEVNLQDIRSIVFTPGASFFDNGEILIESEDGDFQSVFVGAIESDDKRFFDSLRRLADEARESAGKPPCTVSAPGEGG